jgi:hypothetical protein
MCAYADHVGQGGTTCNPSTKEAKVGGLRIQGQPGLHSKTLSQKKSMYMYTRTVILLIPDS